MDNIIDSLPSKVSPAAIAAGAAIALKVGPTTAATTLLEIFVREDVDDTKIAALRRMALEDKLSCVEFSKACKEAQEKADAMDKLSGFTAAADAKGSDKYGPNRRVLNQRLSEAKQLFGVFKLQPDVLKERGYWSALDASRTYLGECGMKWDGQAVDTADSKDAKQRAKLARQALEEVMQANPMQAGESIRDYNERMAKEVDATIEEKQADAADKEINNLVKMLTKKYDGSLLIAACLRIMESDIDNVDDYIAYLSEAKSIHMLDATLVKAAEEQAKGV